MRTALSSSLPNNVGIIKDQEKETVKEKNTRTTWEQTLNPP